MKQLLIPILFALSVAVADQASAEICSITDAMSKEWSTLIERAGNRAEGGLIELEEMQRLVDKVPANSNRPIVELLSGQDAARFAQLSQRSGLGVMLNMIESARERDLTVLDDMMDTAERLYLGRSVDEVTREEPARVLLVAMRMTFPDTDLTVDEDRVPHDCSIESALVRRELDSLPRTIAVGNDMELTEQKMRQQMQALRLKYNVADGNNFDDKNVSSDDKKHIDRFYGKLYAIGREINFLHDIENIRSWNNASNLVYKSRMEDLANYGPDIHSIGKTYREKDLDERMKKMNGFWNLINEQVPSQWQKQLKTDVKDSKQKQ